MFSSRTNWQLEPNRLARAIADHRRSGRPLLDLTTSNPTTCGFSYPEQEILAALSDRRALDYAPESRGRLEARQAIADYYHARRPVPAAGAGPATSLDPERIFLTASTSEAYSYIFRLLCEPGDEILVPAPSYPLFAFLADLADVQLVPYSLIYDHGWQIDFAALRAALSARSRAVLVVHPNNPTGSFVKPHEAAELARLCAGREMAIVADEVFLDYAGCATPQARSFAQDIAGDNAGALTFTLSGLSKISALPQMKLAWLVVSGPETLAGAAAGRLDVIADTYLSVGTPAQLALPKLLALGGGMQAQLQERIVANLNCLDEILRAPGAVTRLECEGGWYAVLRVPVSLADEALAVELVERSSVLAHPGSFYNFPAEGFLVVSLITPLEDFQEGVRRLRQFFE